MRGTAELVLARNVYCLAAVVVLASSLVGSASGSCLSYGHSCWGAHGKRSGHNVHGLLLQQRPVGSNAGEDDVGRTPPLDERWLLSRLVNRPLMQVPLVARLRAARILDGDRPIMENIENIELKDLEKSDQKLIADEPDNLLIPEQGDASVNENDEAMRAGLFKILRNID